MKSLERLVSGEEKLVNIVATVANKSRSFAGVAPAAFKSVRYVLKKTSGV
jgi:hypothetical protein